MNNTKSVVTTDNHAVMQAKMISKSFGDTHALKEVNFSIYRAQVTTLFGENGAGKSTLMNILSGILTPTSGEILLDGKPVSFSSSANAQSHGVSIIHQELSLAPNMNVRDNIFMGREIQTIGGIDYSEEERQTQALMQELEEDIHPLTLVEDLRLGQQQIVEIARALSVNSRILIMDEPTSALSATEVEVLFKVIHDLTARGVSIVYISHHLKEALQITHHAVVLRDGVITASAPSSTINLNWIVKHMVGDNFSLGKPPKYDQTNKVALSINQLSIANPTMTNHQIIDRFSLEIKTGEIVCIYGLMGAGRSELMECIAGRLKASSGKIHLFGKDLTKMTIAERIKSGLVLVPEDRQRDGLVQTMDVGKNLSLASIGTFASYLLLSKSREKTLINDSIENIAIKTGDEQSSIGDLSGGNQQKVVIGKMLATHPKVILLDEPSRGIDIGAKAEVFKLLRERTKDGLSIIYTTSEVEECLSIAHKIIVLRRGQISATFDSNVNKEAIMAASGESLTT